MIRYAQNSINLTGIDLTKMENKKLFTFLGALPILLDGNGHEKVRTHGRVSTELEMEGSDENDAAGVHWVDGYESSGRAIVSR